MVNLADQLRAQGLDDILREYPGWQGRGRPYSFNPIGVLNHHDALNDGVSTRRGLEVIRDGRSDLPGPLSQFWLEDDGLVYLVADGNANHAGRGAGRALDRIRRDLPPLGDMRTLGWEESTVGNPYLWGIEVHNAGVSGDPYEDVQIRSLVRLNAALCNIGGWSAARCWHHREWTRRKPDMSWRGDLRGLVAAQLEDDDDMKPFLCKTDESHAVWIVDASLQSRQHVPTPTALRGYQQLLTLGGANDSVTTFTSAESKAMLADIPIVVSGDAAARIADAVASRLSGAGTGLSEDQVRQAARDGVADLLQAGLDG